MTRARWVFILLAAVGVFGFTATTLAVGQVARAVSFGGASSGELWHACRSLALPTMDVGSVIVLLLGSIAFAVLWLAVRSALKQLRASQRFLASLRMCCPAPVGPPGTRLFVDDQPQAFCAGLFRPRIYVSSAALEQLTPIELDAVLAHEAHHVRYRDPLRILFARTVGDALFFMPAARRLASRYEALAELAADAAAVKSMRGNPAPLASALLSFDEHASAAVVGIAPERADQLLGAGQTWQLPAVLLVWSFAVAAALVVVVQRTAALTDHTAIELPLLTAQLCMITMAVAPLLVGALALLTCRRVLSRSRTAT